MSQIKQWVNQNRQLALLLALVAVALLLWARMLLPGGGGPSAVEAGPGAGASAGAALVSDPADAVGSIQDLLPRALPTERVAMPERPERDLFVSGGWGRMENRGEIGDVGEKSDLEASDENRRLALESAARSRLKLQSVIAGDSPQAVINGQVLRPGERVEGFELVSVGRRSVLVSYEGYVIRISM